MQGFLVINLTDWLGFIFSGIGGGLAELLYLFKQSGHLSLHFVHSVHEAEGHLDAGEVQAHLLGQSADALKAVHVGGGVEALATDGTGGGEEAGALVVTKGLGVEADHSGGDADDEAGL